jgi:dihydrofolate reductase
MRWVFKYAGPNPEVDGVIRTTGAVLLGRRSYGVAASDGAPDEARRVYGGAWKGPLFVLTHRPPERVDDPAVTFLSCDIGAAVARARDAANGKNVVLIGASVARQSVDAGLVDEILVHLVPVMLGDGVRFFGRPERAYVELERVGVSQAGPVTNLRYRVVRGTQ